MPNRMLRESVCANEKILTLDWFEEVVFYRLLVNADDYGRMDARPPVLLARLFPVRRDVGEAEMAAAIEALLAAGLVRRYEVGGMPFLQLCGWETHQKLRYRREGYPAPAGEPAGGQPAKKKNGKAGKAPPACACAGAGGHACAEEKRSEGKKRRADTHTAPEGAVLFPSYGFGHGNSGFVPPTEAQVAAYCSERGLGVDAARFVDFYESKGWVVGTSPMRNWQAAVNMWEWNRRADEEAGSRAEANASRAIRAAGINAVRAAGKAAAANGKKRAPGGEANPFKEAGL